MRLTSLDGTQYVRRAVRRAQLPDAGAAFLGELPGLGLNRMLKRARVVAVRERAKRLLERSVGKRERSMTVETRCVFVPVMPWIIACRLRRRELGSRAG
jgi:hypothetical protein